MMVSLQLLNSVADKALAELEQIRARFEADPCPSEIDQRRALNILAWATQIEAQYHALGVRP